MKATVPATIGIPKPGKDVLDALKANVEDITGQNPRKGKLEKLGASATLAGVINKINEIIDRLQE